ncbi:MAG: hypothetical protein NVV74_18095 [Magnetospirillum sp.]|nr:hypothetical protein [Magnetospirillum sp.]
MESSAALVSATRTLPARALRSRRRISRRLVGAHQGLVVAFGEENVDVAAQPGHVAVDLLDAGGVGGNAGVFPHVVAHRGEAQQRHRRDGDEKHDHGAEAAVDAAFDGDPRGLGHDAPCGYAAMSPAACKSPFNMVSRSSRATMRPSTVTSPDRKRVLSPWSRLGNRLDVGAGDGDDVGHRVHQDAQHPVPHRHDDGDVARRRFGQMAGEAGAQVEDRNDGAAQVDHAAQMGRGVGQFGGCRPSFDFADGHDVHAVFLVSDGERDELADIISARDLHGPPTQRVSASIALGRGLAEWGIKED